MHNILIFDSGLGGLSIFSEIHKLCPDNNYDYLFDNDAYPYGQLDSEILEQRSVSLIRSMASKKKYDVIVIACNTASTIMLDSLRKTLAVPIVGVVPAIKPASQISQTKMALLATPATILRNYTHQLIEQFSSLDKIQMIPSIELVNLAEEKLKFDHLDLKELTKILAVIDDEVDTLILGCTHFPLLRKEIETIVGDKISVIDSGYAIAKRVQKLLENQSETEIKAHKKSPWTAYYTGFLENEARLNEVFKRYDFTQLQRYSDF